MKATATNVKHRFGYYMEKARTEPVTVEKTDRPYVVILNHDLYLRLQALEDRYWGEKAKAIQERGDYLGHEETMASLERMAREKGVEWPLVLVDSE